MFAYCGNNPVTCSDPTGEFWWPIIIPLILPLFLGGCNSEGDSNQGNCYTYALRLESNPDSGENSEGAIDPGGLVGEDIAKSQLYSSPEAVKELFENNMKMDAQVLGYTFKEVIYPGMHKPADGNWLIYVAYCSEPSKADYHFWRKEPDGTWSHYYPARGIMYTDFSGKTITDPMFSNVGKYYAICVSGSQTIR